MHLPSATSVMPKALLEGTLRHPHFEPANASPFEVHPDAEAVRSDLVDACGISVSVIVMYVLPKVGIVARAMGAYSARIRIGMTQYLASLMMFFLRDAPTIGTISQCTTLLPTGQDCRL